MASFLKLQRFRALQVALITLIIALGLMSIGLPFLARSTKDAIERTTSHDVAWSGANGRDEFRALHIAILNYYVKNDAGSFEHMRLCLDIAQARLETWRSGAFWAFLNSKPQFIEYFRDLEKNTGIISQNFFRNQAQTDRATAGRIVDAIMRSANKIATSSYIYNTNEISKNNKKLQKLQSIQQKSIILLIVSGFGLIIFLFWQKKLLIKANAVEKKAAMESAFLASHDVLTGLANRSAVSIALKKQYDAGGAFAVVMLDLDGFKPINDVLGHGAGDALLVSVAERLNRFVQGCPGSIAGRFGGDEFVLLLADVATSAGAMAAGNSLIELLQAPHQLDGHHVQVSASAGVAMSDGLRDAGDITVRADLALSAAKNEGRSRAVIFAEEMLHSAKARSALEADLNASDFWREIVPNFQPIVDLESGAVVGCEALARWIHPVRGAVSPGEFIPVAEHCGRIIEIGEVMLMKACAAAAAMPLPIVVSVNVSAAQLLRTNLPDLVAMCLFKTGLPASRLKLEITESVMIGDRGRILKFLTDLRHIGVTVSLDDFGTGYSSMAYLRDLPFDEIKIDRSFVESIETDTQARAIVQTIITLSQNLDMRVVAEGIETDRQFKLLAEMGCTRGQGYFFGRPVVEAEFRRALERSARGTLQRRIA